MENSNTIEEIKAQARKELIDELKQDYTFEIPNSYGWEKVVRFESIKNVDKKLDGCKHL